MILPSVGVDLAEPHSHQHNLELGSTWLSVEVKHRAEPAFFLQLQLFPEEKLTQRLVQLHSFPKYGSQERHFKASLSEG